MEEKMDVTEIILNDQRCRMFRKVAVIDGQGENAEISLNWRDEDGEDFGEIQWPDDWPEWVSVDFLKGQGYQVITA